MITKLLRELAERCEREKPSWQLDDAIAQAALGLPPCGTAGPPPYTSSIDAAVTLEPADAIEVCVRKYRASDIYVRITPASGPPIDCRRRTDSITEPMARCAASLRARAAIAEQTEASTQPGEANP